MERIKRFLAEESGDAYITSIVVCVAVVAIVLAAVYSTFFEGGIQGFFNKAQTAFGLWGDEIPDSIAS